MRPPLVLNTRPLDQATELSDRLRAAGLSVVEAPAIAIAPAWEAATLERTRHDLRRGAFAWAVLSSQNAGRDLEHELRAQAGLVLCGSATAGALGLSCARTLERFSAAAALNALRPLVSGGQRVLVPRAAEGREELVDGLRGLGVDVFAPIAYRTVPCGAAAESLRRGGVDVLTLCSPSAVGSVASEVSEETLVVCLGKTTADAARRHGLRVDRVADTPNMAALLEGIQIALGLRV
jgi:uroporphyrinogen-III synthase